MNLVLISADAEWRAFVDFLSPAQTNPTPYGAYFDAPLTGTSHRLRFFHGGWGKIDAAASTQWALATWRPARAANLGTAGGFPGRVREGEILYVTRAEVYDIIERMSGTDEAARWYQTELEPMPAALRDLATPGAIVSGDQDLDPAGVPELMRRYDALAGDWESAAIARVCQKNQVPIIILRAISDVVSSAGSRAYGQYADFESQTRALVPRLLGALACVW